MFYAFKAQKNNHTGLYGGRNKDMKLVTSTADGSNYLDATVNRTDRGLTSGFDSHTNTYTDLTSH